MGLDTNMQLIMSGILNVTQLVGVSTSVWTMDTLGRRPLLLVGSAIMAISHIIIAVLVGMYGQNWPAHRAEGWASVAMLLVYMLFFGASWGPVPWGMPSGKLLFQEKSVSNAPQKSSHHLFVQREWHCQLAPTG